MEKKRSKMSNPNLGTCSKCKETFVNWHYRAERVYQAYPSWGTLLDHGGSRMVKKQCPDCAPEHSDRRMDCVQYLRWRSG